MSADLPELWVQYNDFFDQYWADIRATDGPKTNEELFQETRRRRTFDEFVEMWAKVCQDPETKGRWLRHLAPGGYEAFKKEINDQTDAFLAELERDGIISPQ